MGQGNGLGRLGVVAGVHAKHEPVIWVNGGTTGCAGDSGGGANTWGKPERKRTSRRNAAGGRGCNRGSIGAILQVTPG